MTRRVLRTHGGPGVERSQPDMSRCAPGDASRRRFLVSALASVPALAYLCGCQERLSASSVEALEAELWREMAGRGGRLDAAGVGLSQHERRRRWRMKRLLLRHVWEENQHDLEGIMRTMAEDAEMVVNAVRFDTPEAIREGHAGFGMSDRMGGLLGTRVVMQHEYFTDDAILTSGYLDAQHVGVAADFPGTGAQVQLAYAAFYTFDRNGKLVSERITMDWLPLVTGVTLR